MHKFTKDFRKKELALNIPLNTQQTLLKYIGSLQGYIYNTIFLLMPSILDEVCIHATYIEVGKKCGGVSMEYILSKEDKGKGKEKPKRTIFLKNVNEKLSCFHCKKEGHNDDHHWNLHPYMRPKWF